MAKEPSGEFVYSVLASPVTWDDAQAWMDANGFPSQPKDWNVYCNGDRSQCTVAKEPSGEFVYSVLASPVTWDDAQTWMDANGFPSQPKDWNVYCNGDRSQCTVAKEISGEFKFMYKVFASPVTWDDAWAWMDAN